MIHKTQKAKVQLNKNLMVKIIYTYAYINFLQFFYNIFENTLISKKYPTYSNFQ